MVLCVLAGTGPRPCMFAVCDGCAVNPPWRNGAPVAPVYVCGGTCVVLGSTCLVVVVPPLCHRGF